MDERYGPSHEMLSVEIEINETHTMKDAPRSRTKGDRAMEFINQQRIHQSDVNEMMIYYAKCLGAEL